MLDGAGVTLFVVLTGAEARRSVPLPGVLTQGASCIAVPLRLLFLQRHSPDWQVSVTGNVLSIGWKDIPGWSLMVTHMPEHLGAGEMTLRLTVRTGRLAQLFCLFCAAFVISTSADLPHVHEVPYVATLAKPFWA